MASIQRFAEITQAFDPEATRTLGQAFDMACARECEIVMTAGPKSCSAPLELDSFMRRF